MNKKIDQLCANLSQILVANRLMLVTVESCTGGGVAYYLTNQPGSSVWFERGFVTYCNQAKMDCVHVPSTILAQFGAVSEETVRAMAEGGLRNSMAQVSLAITGIAGPGGGTDDKPLGTVWIAYASHTAATHSYVCHFLGTRISVREQTILSAISGLIDYLQK